MADNKSAEILRRMLAEVDPSYDKATGSFPYDMLAPMSIEAERLYKHAEFIELMGFADTAEGEYLDRICAEQNVVRKRATAATGFVTLTGEPGRAVQTGMLVASSRMQFVVSGNSALDADGRATVPVTAAVAGAAGNAAPGTITIYPMTISGLYAVTNAEATEGGYDEESDDELRERYYIKVRTPATSGNANHYKQWAMEVTGVGGVKVQPLWAGNGTVKVIIIDSNKRGAPPELIADTISHIEALRPIGATVTVISAAEVAVNVAADVTLADGYTLADAKGAFEDALAAYLKTLAFVKNMVSYAIIGGLLLDTPGVADYGELYVNGGTANIAIGETSVAAPGSVTLT